MDRNLLKNSEACIELTVHGCFNLQAAHVNADDDGDQKIENAENVEPVAAADIDDTRKAVSQNCG